MNILFLSLSRFENINSCGIYPDLLRELIRRGHEIYIVSPIERRFGKNTHLVETEHCRMLKVKTLNIQKTNVIEKGIGTLLVEWQFDKAIRKYWKKVRFDLVLYATPPITFNRVIERVKRRCGARSYLMLKDIFPQNAVDLGMMKKEGFLHKMFRKKEKRLYEISDRIGCMSPANRDYILTHNSSIDISKVELCPNAIELTNTAPLSGKERKATLRELNIPSNKTVFIYGGNLGKPQGLDFLLKVLEANEQLENSHIVVIGNGTERAKIAKWFEEHIPQNSTLLSALPKNEYDNLVRACDVGLIFLDPRFTIPNFPSRLLSYLENSMPVLLATDKNTDMGKISETEGFGMWCESGDLEKFISNIKNLADNPTLIKNMGCSGYKYLTSNYTVDKVAPIVLREKA